MLPITLRSLKDKKISFAIYSVASILLVWMFVGMFPTILQEAEQFQQLIANYPQSFFDAFGIEEFGFDTIEKFLALEMFSIMWPIMAIFLLSSRAGHAIAGEIEKGTIEILLSKPISRIRIFAEKYLAGILTLLLFTIVAVYAVVPLAELYNIDYAIQHYAPLALISFAFGWAIFSLAMMFSAMFSERSKVYMATGGVLLVMYAANIAASLLERIENFKYISFFHYFDYDKALIHNELNITSMIVFIVCAIVFTVVGLIWFHKRDINA